MVFVVGRLVFLALGFWGSFQDTVGAEGHPDRTPRNTIGDQAPSVDLPTTLNGFVWRPATQARPALSVVRRGVPLLPAQRETSSQLPEITRRDCLANGTNFCLDSRTNFCTACGICCSDNGGNWCCPSDGVCCGSACCASGQTCNDGDCYLPVATTTKKGTVSVTITQSITVVATVIQKVVDSSTVNAVVEVTDSSAETQTNWVYVTVTTVGKRAEAASTAVSQPAAAPATTTGPPVQERDRRQATAATLSGVASTTTVRQTDTVTSIVTTTVSSTTSVQTTSTVLSTLFQTVTIVLHAKTTVQATSTLTYTSHHPVTLTVTQIATEHASASGSVITPTSTTVPSTPATLVTGVSHAHIRTTLSAGTIAGIAVGAAAFSALVTLVIIVCVRGHRRRVRARQEIEDEYAYFGTSRSSGNNRNAAEPAMTPAYSGPPPPAAAGFGLAKRGSGSVGENGTRNARGSGSGADGGLPLVPWYSRLPRAAFANGVAHGAGPGTETTDGLSPLSAKAGAHMRSSSGQTTGTNASSIVTSSGDTSERTSNSTAVVTAQARTQMQSSGSTTPPTPATTHPQSLSGAVSGTTAQTLTDTDKTWVAVVDDGVKASRSRRKSFKLHRSAVTRSRGFFYRDY